MGTVIFNPVGDMLCQQHADGFDGFDALVLYKQIPEHCFRISLVPSDRQVEIDPFLSTGAILLFEVQDCIEFSVLFLKASGHSLSPPLQLS